MLRNLKKSKEIRQRYFLRYSDKETSTMPRMQNNTCCTYIPWGSTHHFFIDQPSPIFIMKSNVKMTGHRNSTKAKQRAYRDVICDPSAVKPEPKRAANTECEQQVCCSQASRDVKHAPIIVAIINLHHYIVPAASAIEQRNRRTTRHGCFRTCGVWSLTLSKPSAKQASSPASSESPRKFQQAPESSVSYRKFKKVIERLGSPESQRKFPEVVGSS